MCVTEYGVTDSLISPELTVSYFSIVLLVSLYPLHLGISIHQGSEMFGMGRLGVIQFACVLEAP